MKPLYHIILLVFGATASAQAQQVDSIFFHLYTDSLKKGTYNYINVDGKTHAGSWLPLTNSQLNFSASGGKFEGNSLVLDKDFSSDSVVISVALKSNTLIKRTVTIYIKKAESSEKLKTKEEIMEEIRRPKKGR